MKHDDTVIAFSPSTLSFEWVAPTGATLYTVAVRRPRQRAPGTLILRGHFGIPEDRRMNVPLLKLCPLGREILPGEHMVDFMAANGATTEELTVNINLTEDMVKAITSRHVSPENERKAMQIAQAQKSPTQPTINPSPAVEKTIITTPVTVTATPNPEGTKVQLVVSLPKETETYRLEVRDIHSSESVYQADFVTEGKCSPEFDLFEIAAPDKIQLEPGRGYEVTVSASAKAYSLEAGKTSFTMPVKPVDEDVKPAAEEEKPSAESPTQTQTPPADTQGQSPTLPPVNPPAQPPAGPPAPPPLPAPPAAPDPMPGPEVSTKGLKLGILNRPEFVKFEVTGKNSKGQDSIPAQPVFAKKGDEWSSYHIFHDFKWQNQFPLDREGDKLTFLVRGIGSDGQLSDFGHGEATFSAKWLEEHDRRAKERDVRTDDVSRIFAQMTSIVKSNTVIAGDIGKIQVSVKNIDGRLEKIEAVLKNPPQSFPVEMVSDLRKEAEAMKAARLAMGNNVSSVGAQSLDLSDFDSKLNDMEKSIAKGIADGVKSLSEQVKKGLEAIPAQFESAAWAGAQAGVTAGLNETKQSLTNEMNAFKTFMGGIRDSLSKKSVDKSDPGTPASTAGPVPVSVPVVPQGTSPVQPQVVYVSDKSGSGRGFRRFASLLWGFLLFLLLVITIVYVFVFATEALKRIRISESSSTTTTQTKVEQTKIEQVSEPKKTSSAPQIFQRYAQVGPIPNVQEKKTVRVVEADCKTVRVQPVEPVQTPVYAVAPVPVYAPPPVVAQPVYYEPIASLNVRIGAHYDHYPVSDHRFWYSEPRRRHGGRSGDVTNINNNININRTFVNRSDTRTNINNVVPPTAVAVAPVPVPAPHRRFAPPANPGGGRVGPTQSAPQRQYSNGYTAPEGRFSYGNRGGRM